MTRDEAFKMLDDIAKGIAITFGPNCETLIQDYGLPNHPIISIYNNNVSGRSIGSEDEISDGASRYVEGVQVTDHLINCFALRGNKKIKATSFNFKGDDYFFCFGINFDFTTLAETQSALAALTIVNDKLNVAVDQNLLSKMFDEAVRQINVPVERMKKSDRIRIVQILESQKAFTFQKSVPYVADRLNVSRLTVYQYLKELSSQQ